MKYLFSVLFLCACLLPGCQSSQEGEPSGSAESEIKEMSQEEHNQKIEAIAAEMKEKATEPIDKKMAGELIDLSKSYGQAYPRDGEKTPAIYFRAAEVARGIRNYKEAIALFDLIYNNYPEHPKAPAAMFLQAFAYEDGLQDKEKAKEVYQALMDKYPEDPLAEQAKMLLQVIDKTPEEMVREFQKKNKK